MPEVNSASSVRTEDLSPALIMSDVRNTPVTSRMKKGEQLKDMIFSWPAEKMGARRAGGIPENKDVDAFEGDAQSKLYNRAERFWRTPRVTIIAEKVIRNVDESKGRYNKQVTKKIKEQKRDIEWEIVSDQESTEDNGVTGDKFKGLGRVINDGTLPFTDVPTTIPAGFRTPAAQIYSGTLANFSEANLRTMLQSRYDSLGATTELAFFVASGLKARISEYFGQYKADKAGYTIVARTQSSNVDSRKLNLQGIDVIEGDFGTIEIVLVPFMPTNLRGYGLDMDQVVMRPLMYCDHTELPYQGGGRSGLIDSILGYEFGDPRGHFKIAPSDEVARDGAGS